jgi:hypothetical protein
MNGAFDPADPATVLLGGGGGWSTGTLVSPRVILTCGHCVDPQGEPRSFAYFGSSYLDGGTTVMVERSYPHPQYVSGAYPNIDLGIVVLKTPVEVTPSGFQTAPLDGGVVGARSASWDSARRAPRCRVRQDAGHRPHHRDRPRTTSLLAGHLRR